MVSKTGRRGWMASGMGGSIGNTLSFEGHWKPLKVLNLDILDNQVHMLWL